MTPVPRDLEFEPALPRHRERAIGCIGAGFIMADCHLVAYREAGFRPVAVWSRSLSKARQCAERHAIPRVHTDWRDVLQDPEVEVVDIAVPPLEQPEILRECVRYSGKIRGVLAQKPLALDLGEARELVDLLREHEIVLAVNQNMRYDHSVRALKDLLGRGTLGEPILATIDMRAIPHWMDWARDSEKLTYFLMSIHHLDTFRFLFGDPTRVLASCRTDPRTKFPHTDGITLYILEYTGGLRCLGLDDVWTGPAREGAGEDIYIRLRVEGTEGTAECRIGWPSYPERTPSTLRFTCREGGTEWIEPRWDRVWFPDAFRGPMGELLKALEEGREPEIGGRDNLHTLALVEACWRGAHEHRVVELAEVLRDGRGRRGNENENE